MTTFLPSSAPFSSLAAAERTKFMQDPSRSPSGSKIGKQGPLEEQNKKQEAFRDRRHLHVCDL